MATLQQNYSPAYTGSIRKESVIVQFFTWCAGQEKNRYGWLAAIIALHGCVLSPITVLTIAAGGNNIIYWGMAIGAMGMSLISNLAAMPTKITIPIFALSIVIDLTIISICLGSLL